MFESQQDPNPGGGMKLALSVVRASVAPMLLVTRSGEVVGASDSFHEVFGVPETDLAGKLIFDLDDHRWNGPRLRSLMQAAASGIELLGTYEFAVDTSARGLRTVAMGISLLDGANPDELLLISLEDRTAAIAAEAEQARLVHDNAVLMREVQHRIANSLQIIASILLQSARRIRSPEARGKVQDAHQRIVSIALLQRQLSVSAEAEVDLHDYLGQLCDSIAASMIQDRQRIRLVVKADRETVAPARSITLGLIVTELVINSLKHAFTDVHGGTILVGYAVDDDGWVLTVEDDGVGPPPAAERTVGLGTHIVDALARQLDAVVAVVPLVPGTRVTLRHEPAARADAADTGEALMGRAAD